MARVLLLTVGTGTRPDRDIVRPLVKTVRSSHPDLTVFLVTEESEPNARRVTGELGLAEGSWELVRLPDADDVDRIFQQTRETLRSLEARGYASEELELDYTTGTKSMSVGAVLAGLASGCRTLKYVAGKREGGVVMDGTERILTVEPGPVLAERQLSQAWALFERLRFDAALQICKNVRPPLLGESSRLELADLERLIRGYQRWDKFDHIGAAAELSQVDFSRPWNADFRVPGGFPPDRLRSIGGCLKQGGFAEDVRADLANNALRRHCEGKYDDAVARLYRLVEMVAQRELDVRHGIRTNNVALGKVPEGLRGGLEIRRDKRDGRVKIGLMEAYCLLEALGSPLGSSFQANQKLAALLQRRNSSILAHGTVPVERETCEGLFREAMALAELAMPGFAARRAELQFPWLPSTLPPDGLSADCRVLRAESRAAYAES